MCSRFLRSWFHANFCFRTACARRSNLLSALFRRRFPSVSTTLLAAQIDSSWIPPKLKWCGVQLSASAPVTILCVAVFRRFCRSGKVCTRSGNLHRCRSVYADARTANGITVLWCSATTASDPPICSDGHSTDAGCQAGTVSAWLWQQRTSRHTSLSSAPSAIGVERGSTADLSAKTLWPHHWCSSQSTLATSARAHSIQDRRTDVRHSATVPWTTRPSSRSAWSAGTPLCQLQSPGGADVPTVYSR